MKDCNLPAPAFARFTVGHIARRGWVVRDPDGRMASEIIAARSSAEMLRDRLQHEADAKAKRGPRPCMCCGKTFESEGIHNRLCPHCRAAASGLRSSVSFAGATGKARRVSRLTL